MKLRLRDKTILVILSTSLFALVLAGVLINLRVQKDFNSFLDQQTVVFQKMGSRWSVVPSLDIFRELRQDEMHKRLENEFDTRVWGGIALAGGIATVGALGIGWFFANRVTEPLERLKKFVQKLRKHEYDESMPPIGDNEIRDLAVSFEELRVELERVEQLRKDAISDMAHEITTPLQTLLGVVEGIAEGLYDGKAKVVMMKDAISRMQELVDDMRLFSHARAKKRDIKWEQIELRPFVESELASLLDLARGKGLEIKIDIADDLHIKADRKMLGQILANLIKNAVQYTDEGSIGICVVETRLIASLQITDTGCGIAAEDLPYVFERFYRGDKSRNRETGGTGLGLAIVKEYIEQLGWQIAIESEQAAGTKVTLAISQTE